MDSIQLGNAHSIYEQVSQQAASDRNDTACAVNMSDDDCMRVQGWYYGLS